MIKSNLIIDKLMILTALATWEVWLKGFCLGFFIFGLIVIAFVLVTMGVSAGHAVSHEIDHDTEISFDKDMSIDKDISIDKDVSFDKDISIDKDISFDKDFSIDDDFSIDKDISIDNEVQIQSEVGFQLPNHVSGPMTFEKGSSAPLLLTVAVFSISFGGLGLLLFWQEPTMNSYLRLMIILIVPIIMSIIVELVWRKVAVSESYRLPTIYDYLGREAVVLVPVDAKGGTIRVELPDQLEPIKVPAKSVHRHQTFVREELVFIVGIEKSFYLVDNTRDLLEGKVRKELVDEEED